jgi:hypothetical protein
MFFLPSCNRTAFTPGKRVVPMHLTWFDDACSQLLHKRKEAKLQSLQDPNEMNGDNLNNAGTAASRSFGNNRRGQSKDKSDEQ